VKQKRTFWGVALIPICFVLTAFLLDLALFLIINVPFPRYYAVSLLFLITFAGAVSCIPKRWIQITIFSACIIVQTITTIANLIAFHNLGEIFIFELLGSFREIFAGAGAAKYDGTVHYIIIGSITAAFFAACISVGIVFRKQKAGYPRRPFIAAASAVMLMFAGIFAHLAAIDNRRNMSNLDRLLDPRFNLAYFTDRSKVLFSFGSPIYYYNNILKLMGFKSMANSPVAAMINRSWDGEDYYDNYEFMLDADYNAIMIMMETVEFDSLHPLLTPNLYWIKDRSTSVDGYYAMERTNVTEYVSLVGSHVRGIEMWRDRWNIRLPQSLPNVFRRSFEAAGHTDTSIGAFHTFWSDFYSRNRFFMQNHMGFDFLHDLSTYDTSIVFADGLNLTRCMSTYSDIEFVTEAIKRGYMAPDDLPFFNYFLNITTHAPHFNSAHTVFVNGQYQSIFTDSLRDVLAIKPNLLQDERFRRLESSHSSVRDATMAYLVGLKEYDEAVGVLLRHLRNTPDFSRGRDGSTMLIDHTALIVYSDHFSYTAHNHRQNTTNGGLVSRNYFVSPIGEKCVFMIFNPKDQKPRTITSFMANVDIYRTVCHLFNIQTHDNFTLGSSVLARPCCCNWGKPSDFEFNYGISVGIGLFNGLFIGTCPSNPDLHFTTRDFRRFSSFNNVTGVTTSLTPPQETVTAFRNRMEDFADTLIKTRSFFDGNRFRNDYRLFYLMGGRPVS